MRIVHIIDRLPPDGAERLLCEILRYRNSAHDYQVVCLVEGGEFESVIRDLGVPVTIFGKKPGVDLHMLWRLWRWLQRQKPDVVHTHLFTADTWGRIAARLAGVPAIFSTVHSVNSWQGSSHRAVDRLLATITTRLVACTRLVADKLVNEDRISPARVVTLANGVDLARFEQVQPVDLQQVFSVPVGVPVLAVLGRLEPVKGQVYLLECLARLQQQGVAFHCLLIGDGPDREALEMAVKEQHLHGRVTFAGFRRDVPQLLAAIDILVIPSRWEGLPMALLEAMAMARTVVAHEVGGIGDVINDGVDGVLVPAQQQQAMVEALQRVLTDAPLRQRLGQAARERVEQHYSAEVLSQAYEHLYAEALGLASDRENASG